MTPDRDLGDEHHDPTPTSKPVDRISVLLEQWADDGDVNEVPREVFDLVVYADAMRSCCRACALEANGEDGS